MTTLANRPSTALLVIDVQNDVVNDAHNRDEVVANVATLVDKARAAGVDVVWVQHSNAEHMPKGSDGWQFVSELKPAEGEPVVHKTYADSFEATDLEEVLAGRGIGSLVVSGAQTDECIRSTLHGALVRGYDALLVSDAHTTEDLSEYGAPTPDKVISHTNLYWENHTAPGRSAGVVKTEDAFKPA
ncbi:cysteine hydrolase family protein [Lentzea sp. NEAU-D7]|uniref:cysteine hydrolase family protein n=1 Tax=Lentzea sp. NEAU-D7 TaxID=2994667 RepID=UPI00224A7CAE|nr:isochorismatase family protein [Lentzea sp. NEAU-D7]MCX2947721.1 isochorismatase family protein [Lentzea sp. NEAU-D7]